VAAATTVTIDNNAAVASTTTVDGTLAFSTATNTDAEVMLVGGTMTVEAGGTLTMGTTSFPIPQGSTASLTLAYGSSAGKYGLIINNGGNFIVYGSSKTPSTTMSNGTTVGPGTTGVPITVADTTGWQIGDTITIDTEAVVITALPGSNQVTFTQSLGKT